MSRSGDRNRRCIDRSSGAGARWRQRMARRRRMARRSVARYSLARCGVAQRSLAWWMARPLLSTSPVCVFPSSPLRTVLRRLRQRLFVLLELGADGLWLATGLGLRPVRLRLRLGWWTAQAHFAAHSRASGNPVDASKNPGSPPTRGRAAGVTPSFSPGRWRSAPAGADHAVNPSALSFFRRPLEKSTWRRS